VARVEVAHRCLVERADLMEHRRRRVDRLGNIAFEPTFRRREQILANPISAADGSSAGTSSAMLTRQSPPQAGTVVSSGLKSLVHWTSIT
jgi:hypothetical protein